MGHGNSKPPPPPDPGKKEGGRGSPPANHNGGKPEKSSFTDASTSPISIKKDEKTTSSEHSKELAKPSKRETVRVNSLKRQNEAVKSEVSTKAGTSAISAATAREIYSRDPDRLKRYLSPSDPYLDMIDKPFTHPSSTFHVRKPNVGQVLSEESVSDDVPFPSGESVRYRETASRTSLKGDRPNTPSNPYVTRVDAPASKSVSTTTIKSVKTKTVVPTPPVRDSKLPEASVSRPSTSNVRWTRKQYIVPRSKARQDKTEVDAESSNLPSPEKTATESLQSSSAARPSSAPSGAQSLTMRKPLTPGTATTDTSRTAKPFPTTVALNLSTSAAGNERWRRKKMLQSSSSVVADRKDPEPVKTSRNLPATFDGETTPTKVPANPTSKPKVGEARVPTPEESTTSQTGCWKRKRKSSCTTSDAAVIEKKDSSMLVQSSTIFPSTMRMSEILNYSDNVYFRHDTHPQHEGRSRKKVLSKDIIVAEEDIWNSASVISVSTPPKSVTKKNVEQKAKDTSHSTQKATLSSLKTVNTSNVEKKPSSTTVNINNVEKKPSSTTLNTSNVGKKQSSTTVKSSNAGKKPTSTTVNTGKVGQTPTSTTVNSGTVTKKPISTTVNTGVVREKPTSTTVNNSNVGKKPISRTVTTGNVGEKPTSTTVYNSNVEKKPISKTVTTGNVADKPTLTTVNTGNVAKKPISTPVTTDNVAEKPTLTTVNTSNVAKKPISTPINMVKAGEKPASTTVTTSNVGVKPSSTTENSRNIGTKTSSRSSRTNSYPDVEPIQEPHFLRSSSSTDISSLNHVESSSSQSESTMTGESVSSYDNLSLSARSAPEFRQKKLVTFVTPSKYVFDANAIAKQEKATSTTSLTSSDFGSESSDNDEMGLVVWKSPSNPYA